MHDKQERILQPGNEPMDWMSNRHEREKMERKKASEGIQSFGISFLDEATGGIKTTDLILLGAGSGAGKTELATHIAYTNAKNGKRVAYFALEAEEFEIERRLKYKAIANFYFHGLYKTLKVENLNYQDWCDNKFPQLEKYEDEIWRCTLGDVINNIATKYRTRGDYTVDDFEKDLMEVQSRMDLIIVDHLHYFDFDDVNENRAVKQIVKKIRDLSLISKKPIVLIAHVRKRDKKDTSLMPDLEDFHGTSDIGKIATKAIMIAPNKSFLPSLTRTKWSTLFRVVKNRRAGDRKGPIAACLFDITKNAYDQEYLLGYEEYDKTEKCAVFTQAPDAPPWAKSARNAKVLSQVAAAMEESKKKKQERESKKETTPEGWSM